MFQKVIYFSNIVSLFKGGGGGDSVPNDLVLNHQEDI